MGGGVVGEVSRGIGIFVAGLAFGGRGQHGHLSLGGGLQVGARAVAGVGHGQGLGRGGAEVFAGLLDHRHELARIGFLPGGGAGDDHAFLCVGDGLRVVGMAVAPLDFHAPGFQFHRMEIGRAHV